MVVGEIPFSHQVLPNGSTSYAVPIECALGRAGVQPSITLSYNSLGGNGVVGYGWSIGGLSAIQRTISSYYYDGSAKGTEISGLAQFVLDGVRLIEDSYSPNYRAFVPEQGNIRIEAFMTGAVTNYFKVWYSNGTTAIYGYVSIVGKGVYHTQMLTLNNGSSFGSVDKFSFSRNDTRERMISGAVNSFGVVIKSEYKQLNGTDYPAIYQSGSGAVFPFDDFNAYLWATVETQTWNNNNRKASNSYYYTKAKIHRQGRGFLGFETFSVTDNRGRTVTQTFNPVDFGILVKEESPVSLIEHFYSVALHYFKKTVVIQPTQQKVTDLLKNNVTTTKYTSYDIYSQPLVIETEYGLNSGVKTKREYIYSNTKTTTSYVLGLPEEEKITSTRNGSFWIDKTVISYNTSFLLSAKTTYTGTVGTFQTGYETFNYDSEGNLTNLSFKPYNSTNTLSASYLYDSKKLRITSETNAINLTTTYGYDNLGRMTSSVNHLNQTTSYSYDDLDRQYQVNYPDGVYATTGYTWDARGADGLFRRYDFHLGKPWKKTYFDAFGRETFSSGLNFDYSEPRVEKQYDSYGRLWKVSLPFTGATASYWNTCQYDNDDRLVSINEASGRTTTYSYGQLVAGDSISSAMFKSYSYDTYGRLFKEKETVVDGKWLEKTYNYGSGYLQYTQYVSNTGSIVTENYIYDAGHLKEIKLNGTASIWKLTSVNSFGQPTGVTTGSFNRTYSYNAYGIPTGRTAGSFQSHTYSFDATRGNLSNRKDNVKNIQENFAYDNLNRLTNYAGNTAAYNVNGNIDGRSDIGTFQYNTPGKPYAISGVTSPSGAIPLRNQTITTYTSFKRPLTIAEGQYTADFTYNGSNSRKQYTGH